MGGWGSGVGSQNPDSFAPTLRTSSGRRTSVEKEWAAGSNSRELYSQPSPAEMEKYNRQQQPTADPLRTLPPNLQPYYRQKVSDFFYRQ